MSLDSNRLGNAIASALGVSDETTIAKWVAVATAIISEFTTNGEVNPGTFVDSTSSPIAGKGEIS